MISLMALVGYCFLISTSAGQSIVPDNYNKAFRPPGQEIGKPLIIELSIKINGIREINLERMSVVLDQSFRTTWIDNRLIYPTEYINSSYETGDSISLNSDVMDSIWVPDHYFKHVQSVKGFKLLQKFLGIKIYRNLRIYTSTMIEIELGCPMNFQKYPFDTQTCLIHVASYFYTISEVNFKWNKLGLTIEKAVQRQLSDYNFELKKLNHTTCACKACFPPKAACIEVLLVLRRYYLVHLLGYFIPSTLFMIVSWTSFFWPPHNVPGRTVLVITSLLTVSSMYAASRMDSPKTSYVKAMDVWMFFAIIVGVLTLFQYAVVLQWIQKRDFLKNSKSVLVVKKNQNVQSLINKYERYEHVTETVGRIAMPVLFLFFNAIYWPYIYFAPS